MEENPILEHNNAPYHRGVLDDATHIQYLRNPTCGDEVTIQLRIVNQIIEAAWFTATGCMVSCAGASMTCEYIEKRRLSQLSLLDHASMLSIMAVPLTPHRQQCALLAFNALRALLVPETPTNEVER